MTSDDLANALQRELDERGWTIRDLSKRAGVNHESCRRAVRSIGTIQIDTATAILGAVDLELTITRKEKPRQP